jgi:hypothetical protein
LEVCKKLLEVNFLFGSLPGSFPGGPTGERISQEK